MTTEISRPECVTTECSKPARKRRKKSGGFEKLCNSCFSKKYRRTKQKWTPRLNELRKKGIARSPRRFLVVALGYVRDRCRKKSALGPCTITINDLMGLWDKHHGCCAITKIPMEHRPNTLKTVSIDRIDSSKKYVIDNIQLVCQFINLGKFIHSNDDVKSLLNEFIMLSDLDV